MNLMMILTSRLAKFLPYANYVVDGVSERTFNDAYFKTVPKNQISMYNDFMLVNSFRKATNDFAYSISGEKTDMVTLQFASINGEQTPSMTTMDIFKKQHAHDPELVKFVAKFEWKSWEKQGTKT